LGGKNEQVLDKLKVERERGITGSELSHEHERMTVKPLLVKAQTARYVGYFRSKNAERPMWWFSMIHTFEGKEYLLNLIDTPVGPLKIYFDFVFIV